MGKKTLFHIAFGSLILYNDNAHILKKREVTE